MLNLENAIQKHAEWKIKFRTAISKQETMDAETISKDNQCDLGKWLYGEAKSLYSNLPSYNKLVEKHAAFHKEAAKVARAINAKNFKEAESMLNAGTSYTNASNEVGAAILQLKREAKI
jgi:methyl-accepting chemotaxis protein